MYPSAHNRLTAFVFLPFIFLLILLSSILVSSVSARTWYIKADGSGDAPTIQAGVDSAVQGDSILVAPGSYFDERQIEVGGGPKTVNIYLYKSIKLISEETPERPVIGNSRTDIAIYIWNVDSTTIIK